MWEKIVQRQEVLSEETKLVMHSLNKYLLATHICQAILDEKDNKQIK